MSDYIEVDARGLSCPEPVMLTAAALKKNPGKNLRILASEAHVRTNVEKLLKSKKVNFHSREEGNDFVIETES